jgi:hypothetical protein
VREVGDGGREDEHAWECERDEEAWFLVGLNRDDSRSGEGGRKTNYPTPHQRRFSFLKKSFGPTSMQKLINPVMRASHPLVDQELLHQRKATDAKHSNPSNHRKVGGKVEPPGMDPMLGKVGGGEVVLEEIERRYFPRAWRRPVKGGGAIVGSVEGDAY